MGEKLGFDFFTKLMTNANMGWWKADLDSESYTCSEYIAGLLGLGQDGVISFEDFNKRILKDEQPRTTVHSFDDRNIPEVVYLLNTVNGAVWVRSKICFTETGEDGKSTVYGVAELQDGPNMTLVYHALQQNERILFNIYRHLPVGLELYNSKGILIDVNDKELEIFHLERKGDILGIDIFENPIFPAEMKQKLRNKENADFTFRYDFSKVKDYYHTKKKDGTIDLMTKVTVICDDAGNPVNYLLINADRTETTVAFNRIHEFENLFELVGDYSKVGYAYMNLLTGKGHAAKSWYKNVGEKSGTPLAEIIGIYKHVHPDDRQAMVNFVKNAKKGSACKLSREVRILRANGKCTWTYVNLLVDTYAPQDNIVEIIAINYDITALKKTENKLIKARDKAQESERLKSAFVANMRHEIRTPLNAIVGFSNLMLGSESASEREQYASLINHNNQLLLKLINDVLDISRIESGNVELYPDWFNLSELIGEAILEYKNNLIANVDLVGKYPERDYLIELDQMRIKQILNNLISNALKNTSEGYVEISYEVGGGGIKITVMDTGRGIPKNKIRKIFERFEKVDSFVQGVGLGLPICKSLVSQMHGRIGVDSKLGEGSLFWIELPCRVMEINEE